MSAHFNSPVLNMLPEELAATIYASVHTSDIAPEVQRGVLYKLRSITPKK